MADSGRAIRGAATTTKTTFHTVPAATKFYIKTITVANPTDVPQAINIWVGGRLIFPNINIPKFAGARDEDTHVLATGGLVEVEASTTSLDITVEGVEEV